MKPVHLVVYGEPASKANSRKLVFFGKRPASIKSDKARGYARDFDLQVRPISPLMTGELRMDIWIHYATQRPDLDESLILDLLQGKVYANDRQVRERHVYHHIDKASPRIEVIIRPRDPLFGAAELRSLRGE
ncbi:Crossover junction endodeoxyribonuclease, RusA-like [uncultured Caudovirales phage]|jgi:Holliday junction resolvase RusA-like endonuclease|uniref:Crossover junction endodeoxyribonuclease, RusA-like n=1 Tax=uncultured Caudovirales phage TaxID=2100421 RepID=A0A6J5QCU0_9CAUD|nr:Crossover junction endodeoxyribonuclease, RusA-like [uncultured Caudovirales phage]CAB4181372.1 Crossover junction endodeoxyribonuclease, RusA-like [uncultured Caudovirales phage]CAB4196062.1 Crossover junction endodeoxyribonuclease, RusA-like [uncultured Caudovirales phage]CAB4211893.1 Crossover junction endodeoxyribonuclease, RusA-like [uncultured Caudovirales phage]